MLLVALALSLAAEVKAPIPGQPVEIALELQDFRLVQDGVGGKTLLFGEIAGRATISVLHHESAPYRTSQECADGWKGAKEFTVGDVHCIEKSEEVGKTDVKNTHFHAYPVTPDYAFDLHVSFVHVGKGKPEFTRADFSAIVKSFRVLGQPDRAKLIYALDYYALRDEAAKNGRTQLEWIKARCRERPDDALAHFYLAQLLEASDKDALATDEYALAAERLEQRADLQEKEVLVLLESLDRIAWFRFTKGDYAGAMPYCQRILGASDQLEVAYKGFRQEAFYNLAICHAQTKRTKEGLESLRQALALEPKWKQRASEDELLEPLRSAPEFAELMKR